MTLKSYLFQIPLIGKLKIIVPNIANKLDIEAYGKDPQEAVNICLKFLE